MALLHADDPEFGGTPAGETAGPVIPRPRRPLVSLVLLYLAGLVAGSVLSISSWWVMLLLGAGLVAGVLVRRDAVASAGIFAACAAAGCLTMLVETRAMGAHDIRRQLDREQEHVEWVGRIVDHPQRVEIDERGRAVWQCLAEVESLRRAAGHEPARGTVRVHLIMPDVHAAGPSYGDRWLWRGVVRLDTRGPMLSRGVTGSTRIAAEHGRRLETGTGHPLVAWCYHLRERAHRQLGHGLDDGASSAALTRALLLGLRQDIAVDVQEAFARTGTLHILALSGMHVGILVYLMTLVLTSCGIQRPYWVLFFLPFLALYTIGTGASASTVRAAIMSIAFFSAFLFRRPPDALSSLALAAGAIVLVDPWQVFHLGFVLSFVVVAGILLLYRPLMDMLGSRVAGPAPVWPGSDTWWRRTWHGLRRGAASSWGVSASSWLASLPLIAGIFHLISPIALVVNLAMIPMAFVILLTACLSVIAGAIWPGLGVVFNHANDLFAWLLMELVRVTSLIPGGYAYVKAWPWPAILCWYGALTAWWWAGRRGRRVWMAVMLAMAMGSMLMRTFSRSVEVVALPVGEAAVLVVDGPGDQARLIDAGSEYRARRLIDALRARGIGRLDQVVITRATTDAYGGLAPLLAAMPVGELVIPDVARPSRVFREAREAWRAHVPDSDVRYWDDRRYVEWDGGVIMQWLYPAIGEPYRDARHSAAVLRIARGDRSVLFMGQAGQALETEALRRSIDWNAEALVAGKVELADSLTTVWLDAVRSAVVVYAPGALQRMPHGAGAVERRLRDGGERSIVELAPESPWSMRF